MTRAPDFGDATLSTTTLDHWPAIYGPTPPGEEVASAAVEKSLAVKLNQAYIAWLRRAVLPEDPTDWARMAVIRDWRSFRKRYLALEVIEGGKAGLSGGEARHERITDGA